MSLARNTRAGTRTLYALGLAGAVRGLSLVLIASGVAGGITAVVERDASLTWLVLGLVGGALRALESWLGPFLASAGAVGVKEHWRHRLVVRALGGGGRDLRASDGGVAVLATRGLDEVDDYFLSVLPALTASATVPLILWLRIVLADWVSALILVLTLPLVPVFMVLIGRYTLGRVARAQAAIERLSTHLAELVRGLPVLIGLGRARAQAASLRAITGEYRDATMATLRVAFLSSLALELIASLSVALIAVFIGVRLVGGSLGLEEALLVLVLAPEVFLPLRQLGSAFHAAENGQAAQERAQALADAPTAPDPRGAGDGALAVTGVAVRYPDRSEDALAAVSLVARPGEIHLLDGRSGAGKSTLLAVLAGIQREGVSGTIEGVAPGSVAYLAQAPVPVEDTALRDVEAFMDVPDTAVATGALVRAGLSDSADADPSLMSPGELRRLGLARVLARVDQGATIVLLDEPTAHLDAAGAARVREQINTLGPRVTVVVASHDARVRAMATRRTLVGGVGPGVVSADGAPDAVPDGASGPAGRAPEARAARAPWGTVLRRWRLAVRPGSAAFLLSVVCGVGAALAAVSLTAVSGWLIVRASFQPPIMLLLVAIVGVRFFGLARAVLRYCERLLMHRSILSSMGELRARLWEDFSRRGTANRALLRPEEALRTIVTELDDIRDLTPRVSLPPLVAVIVAAAAVLTGALIHPGVAVVLAAFALVTLVGGSTVALVADRLAYSESLARRTKVLGRLTRLLAAREDIAANGRAAALAEDFRARDTAAEAKSRASTRAAGLGQAVVVACAAAAALVMPVILARPVSTGAVSAELLAVSTLLPLALLEVFGDAVQAARRAPALVRLLRGREDFDAPRAAPAVTTGPAEVERIACQGLAARWPGAPEPVFSGVDAAVRRGQWLRVTGPSGSGKSTLVSVLLRFLAPEAGRYEMNGVDATRWAPEALEGRVAWCPQEAHIFDSSLRANLLLARSREDAPSEAEMEDVLRRLGLAELVESWPRGLDEPLGAAGSRLSGGERQRVAVARTLLTRSKAVVLDEPVAHLDIPTARHMMSDLRAALGESVVVEVTHVPVAERPEDLSLYLTGSVSPSSRRT